MTEIAKDFQSPVSAVEADFAELIRGGKIPYKIDQFTQLLHRKVYNQKQATLRQTQASGEHYLNDTRTFLLRTNMAKDGLVWKKQGGGIDMRRMQ